jgi:hypothetical protein
MTRMTEQLHTVFGCSSLLARQADPVRQVPTTHLCRTTCACLPHLHPLCCCGAALMGSIKILQMDREGVEDRVYRLHYNNSQKRTDTFSLVRHTPSQQLPNSWVAVLLAGRQAQRSSRVCLQQIRIAACQGLFHSYHAAGML